MDDVKPPAKEFHEGEEAVERFEKIVKSAIFTSPAELKKRHERWEKSRKQKKAR